MLIRIVRMTFIPGKEAEFLRLFDAHKQNIRNFPGCRQLELWQDEKDENIFLTYSYWENGQALDQYRDSELFKTVWNSVKALFSAKPQAFSSKKLEEVK